MLRKYLKEVSRSYSYRIKTVLPLDDKAMERIERALIKYDPISIGEVHKSIFQRNPLDFPSISAAEIYMIDVVLGLPASSYILQQDIRFLLNIPEKEIVVRAYNEPTEVETTHINTVADIDQMAKEQGLKPDAFLNNPMYPEGTDIEATELYGDLYNMTLTAYLKTIQDEREDARVKMDNRPFQWMIDGRDVEEQEPVQDKTDFNAGYEYAPAPASVRKNKIGKLPPTGNANDLNTNTVDYKKLYVTKDGKSKVLSKNGTAIGKKNND